MSSKHFGERLLINCVTACDFCQVSTYQPASVSIYAKLVWPMTMVRMSLYFCLMDGRDWYLCAHFYILCNDEKLSICTPICGDEQTPWIRVLLNS